MHGIALRSGRLGSGRRRPSKDAGSGDAKSQEWGDNL